MFFYKNLSFLLTKKKPEFSNVKMLAKTKKPYMNYA